MPINQVKLAFWLCLLLSACASIPLSSLLKLASFDGSDFLAIQPEQVRARISLNGNARLTTTDAKLILNLEFAGQRQRQYQFYLNLLSEQAIVQEATRFKDSQLIYRYLFQINPKSIANFKAYQSEFARFGKPKRYSWNLYYTLLKQPPNNKLLRLDMELKLSDHEDYFYVLKNAVVEYELSQ